MYCSAILISLALAGTGAALTEFKRSDGNCMILENTYKASFLWDINYTIYSLLW